jgi:uncharacterized protein YecT (DUF1311 family)
MEDFGEGDGLDTYPLPEKSFGFFDPTSRGGWKICIDTKRNAVSCHAQKIGTVSIMWRMALAICVLATGALAKDAALYPVKDCGRFTVQMEMNECANDNAQAADDALNATYKQVMASRQSQSDKDGLKQAERTWIKYRDKTCADEVGPQEDGGSIWPMEMANCEQKQTDARIRTLKRMLTCTAGASVCNPH